MQEHHKKSFGVQRETADDLQFQSSLRAVDD